MATTIFGTSGNDSLAATTQYDDLYGLAGNDELTTTFNGTHLSGGSGDDFLWAQLQGNLADTFFSGGNGNDDLVFAGRLTVSPSAGSFSNSILDGGAGDDVLTTTLSGRGLTGDDIGFAIAATVLGGNGSDLITSYRQLTTETDTSRSIVAVENGGAGNDVISSTNIVNATGDTASVMPDVEDMLQGGAGNDEIYGRATLTSAGMGNCVLNGYGDEGDDVISLSGRCNTGEYGVLGVYGTGGSGNDRVAVNANVTGVDFVPGLVASGGSGSDHLSVHGDIDVTGRLGNLTAVAGDNFDVAEDGNDVINLVLDVTAQVVESSLVALIGHGGNDVLTATVTTDISIGGISVDLYGGEGDDRLWCSITGSRPNRSHMEAGDGNDRVIAAGNNHYFISGGAGSDWLTGGSGDDTFDFGALGYEDLGYDHMADGIRDWDVITNYSRAQGDTIDLPKGILDVTSVRVVGDDTRLTLVGDGDVIVLKDVIVDDLASDVLFA